MAHRSGPALPMCGPAPRTQAGLRCVVALHRAVNETGMWARAAITPPTKSPWAEAGPKGAWQAGGRQQQLPRCGRLHMTPSCSTGESAGGS